LPDLQKVPEKNERSTSRLLAMRDNGVPVRVMRESYRQPEDAQQERVSPLGEGRKEKTKKNRLSYKCAATGERNKKLEERAQKGDLSTSVKDRRRQGKANQPENAAGGFTLGCDGVGVPTLEPKRRLKRAKWWARRGRTEAKAQI